MRNSEMELDIIRDTQISDLLENGIDLTIHGNSPIVDVIDPDMFYTDKDQARHLLKFLKVITPLEGAILTLKKQRGISSSR